MSTLQERLRQRVVQRWIHSTGTSPHASGTKPDALCQEAADRLDELEREVEALRKPKPWERCSIHGPAEDRVWACPTCLVELRTEVEALRATIRAWVDYLDSDDPDTYDDGALEQQLMQRMRDAARSKTA